MTQLTREQAFGVLAKAGFPSGPFKTNTGISAPFRMVMVAIGGAESDLTVEAQGPPNKDGSVDRGWIQINSVHGYDEDLLKSDPVYTARAGLQILLQQGVRAWAAYGVRNAEGVYPYVRRMPPGFGGPDVGIGTKSVAEVNKSVQAFLNEQSTTTTPLVVDGAFGPRSEAALVAWKRVHHNDGAKVVNAPTWLKMGVQ
jgi:peptidoglycan hydrolase-like protein with peptidoglycan-binding domain